MSIVLIGYRGSGKTTIGKKLADRLWQPFLDTDDLVAKKAGKSIRVIFEQEGEQRFRDLESAVIRDVAKQSEVVVALGGGAVLRQENVRVLRENYHSLVYLKCDPHELHRRIQSDPMTQQTRPSLTPFGGGLEEIQAVLAEREPVYRAAMTAELDVTHLSPDEAMVYITRLV
ncbi:MAG TPA: shikimate kinase [Tepidisphaeraceae bacterium]|nr:shikimate kinase [Tepidisphaeraceae bacterium]